MSGGMSLSVGPVELRQALAVEISPAVDQKKRIGRLKICLHAAQADFTR